MQDSIVITLRISPKAGRIWGIEKVKELAADMENAVKIKCRE